MNTILLRGTVASKIKFYHSSHGENFYEFRLKSERKSKKEDILICLVPEIILEKCLIKENEKIEVQGEIRTINRKNHKHIYVFVQDAMCGGEVNLLSDVNEVKMDAYICIQPNLRRTSASNRRVCDVIVASNRQYGSDYIPCIAWGRYATYVSKCDVGTHLEIIGRLQSREYHKQMDDGTVAVKTAFEVSVSKVKEIGKENEDEESNDSNTAEEV